MPNERVCDAAGWQLAEGGGKKECRIDDRRLGPTQAALLLEINQPERHSMLQRGAAY